ncbi:MAG: hypothetical protein IT384_03850 [Deltaproteobacteria bacterium]|nr:hypothetical protein [Deltaproteobacteria bacterium]
MGARGGTAIGLGALIAAALAALAPACTLDTSQKNACLTQDDCLDGYTCTQRRCTQDPTWGCLDFDPRDQPSDTPLSLRLKILDASTEAPVPGATVRLCPRTQLACEAPTSTGTTDAGGVVDLTIIDEYLEIAAPGYIDTLAMDVNSLEVSRSGVTPLEVHFDLFSTAGFVALEEASGVVQREQLGVIEALARDCRYESGGGVSFEVDVTDAATVTRYLVNDIPSASATATDVASGAAIFFNAPPGLRSVGAFLSATGKDVRPDQPVAIITRIGWLSHAAVQPGGVRITDATAP